MGIILTAILLLTTMASVQQDASKGFYVESWRRGDRVIQPQKFIVELSEKNPTYQKIVNDVNGKPTYILQIRHSPSKDYLYESWWVDLCNFKGRNKKVKVSSDCLLLTEENPHNKYRDNFPKEDNIGWLYPLENPQLFKDGVGAYPISAKRVVKVDGFYCIIQVQSYKLSSTNPKAVERMTVEIELTNNYQRVK